MTDGLASRGHLAAVLATMNGWPSDACLMDGVAVMGDLIGLKVMFCRFNRVLLMSWLYNLVLCGGLMVSPVTMNWSLSDA